MKKEQTVLRNVSTYNSDAVEITQEIEYNIQNTAKVLNQQYTFIIF